MRFRHIRRGGKYYRIADPGWSNPMDGSYSKVRGGRWNLPGSFSVIYLNGSEAVARANIDRRFAGHSFSPDDMIEDQLPILVETDVAMSWFVDIVTDAGCRAAGLTSAYPSDARGRVVSHGACRPIGQEAFDKNELGIACRSAATLAPPYGEELAWFQRSARLPAARRRHFAEWYFGK